MSEDRLRDAIRNLEGPAELWEHERFQEWVLELREGLGGLRELPWALGSKVTLPQAQALDDCGLGLPKDAKELYETFLAVKAVVHYVEGRLKGLEFQAQRRKNLLKELAAEEAEEKDEEEG